MCLIRGITGDAQIPVPSVVRTYNDTCIQFEADISKDGDVTKHHHYKHNNNSRFEVPTAVNDITYLWDAIPCIFGVKRKDFASVFGEEDGCTLQINEAGSLESNPTIFHTKHSRDILDLLNLKDKFN
jgi:hypothetical protein